MLPEQVAETLEITHRIQRVISLGTPGGKVCSYKSNLPHGVLRRCQPEVTLLQYGTNDLAGGLPLRMVAEEVLSEAKTFKKCIMFATSFVLLHIERGCCQPRRIRRRCPGVQ